VIINADERVEHGLIVEVHGSSGRGWCRHGQLPSAKGKPS
jgi:hypothetical protein